MSTFGEDIREVERFLPESAEQQGSFCHVQTKLQPLGVVNVQTQWAFETATAFFYCFRLRRFRLVSHRGFLTIPTRFRQPCFE